MGLWELCWRIGLALLLGSLIGLERNKRVKDAGIRTHGLVCMGACVLMLLSQFAFNPNLTKEWDSSRIASQTVMGVGFLGVGIMYSKGGAMQGITTAAGIWATVAIGMCCGAGNKAFIYVACVVTALIICFQLLFYHPIGFLAHKTEKLVRIKFVKTDDLTVEKFKSYGKITGYSAQRDGDKIICSCGLSLFDLKATALTLDEILNSSPNIISVEFQKLKES